MRVPVVWCIRLAESAPGRAGDPGLTAGPNEVLTERPGVLALGTSSYGESTDGGRGAEQREDRDPGHARAQGDKAFRAVHMSRAVGPGDSLRCCRVNSADGLSGNECKRLRFGAQAYRASRSTSGPPREGTTSAQ